jgi:hypothetical protein
METPEPTNPAAAGADLPPGRHVVRPAGVLAELLGAAELGEDELLLRLRELGLITYPSLLLEGLLEKVPEVLAAEVLAQLDPTDLVLFGQAARACRAAVVAFGVPHEEVEEASDNSDDRAPRREGRCSSGSGTLPGPSSGWHGQRRGGARGSSPFVRTPLGAGTWRC